MKWQDVTPLVGRSYVCSTGRVFKCSRLGDGALKVDTGDAPPTPEEIKEFETWADSVLGRDPSCTTFRCIAEGDANTKAAYRAVKDTIRRYEEEINAE